jgi:nucleoid-associated protein YgaU
MTKPVWLGVLGSLLIIGAVALTLFFEPNLPQAPGELLSNNNKTGNRDAKKEGSLLDGNQSRDGIVELKESPNAPRQTDAVEKGITGSKSKQDRMPSFDVVRVSPGGDLVVAGKAAPNAVVGIVVGDKEIGRGKSDSNGDWVIIPNISLNPGVQELGLISKNSFGERLIAVRKVIVVVPERVKDDTEEVKQRSGEALAISVPNRGSGTRVLQRPLEDTLEKDAQTVSRAYPRPVSIDAIDYDELGRVVINGRSSPEAKLYIYLNNKLMAQGNSDKKGRWRIVPGEDLSIGSYELRVDQVDIKGKAIRRARTIFERPAVKLNPKMEERIKVEDGNSLWRIARRIYGQGVLYSVIFKANRAQISDPDLIYPGQVFFLPHQERNQ